MAHALSGVTLYDRDRSDSPPRRGRDSVTGPSQPHDTQLSSSRAAIPSASSQQPCSRTPEGRPSELQQADSDEEETKYNKKLSFIRASRNGDETLEALLDTGCTAGNFIPLNFVNGLGYRPEPVQRTCRGVGRGYVSVVGEIELQYKVGRRSVVTTFLVTDDSDVGLILGRGEILREDWLVSKDDTIALVTSINLKGKAKMQPPSSEQEKQQEEVTAGEKKRTEDKACEEQAKKAAKRQDPQRQGQGQNMEASGS